MVSLVSFWCFGGFVSVVSLPWFCFGVSDFSACHFRAG